MILINENFNILSDSEQFLLNNKCDNFVLTHVQNPNQNKKTNNYYQRYKFNFEDSEIKEIIKKIINYVKSITNQNEIKPLGVWINKVNSESNKNDDFHKDVSDLTFLLYLNENFEGGDFEYINEKKEKIKIKPKTNLSIISNSELYHRVLPVTNGERFSLVVFLKVKNKKETTLI